MKNEKIIQLKEVQIKKKAEENAEFLEGKFAQNPIKAKFIAFQETKKNITIKDLF